jgi:hypothetical protein
VIATLAADPEPVLACARKNLRVMRRANEDGAAEGWFGEWERLLPGPLAGVIDALVSHGQHVRDLRQVTPFAGVISDEERRAMFAAAPAT